MLVLQSAKLSPSVKGLKPIDQRLIEYYKLRLSGSIRRTLLYSYSLVRGKVYNTPLSKLMLAKNGVYHLFHQMDGNSTGGRNNLEVCIFQCSGKPD